MRTMENYLIIMLSVILFIFRLIVTITTVLGVDFMIQTINTNYEIILLFITIISIILMTKNKLIGPIIFTAASLAYYGPDLLSRVMVSGAISAESATQIVCSVCCLLIPIFSFFLTAVAKAQEKKPVDKKTDFYYKTDRYDRKYDERADRNNYRTL